MENSFRPLTGIMFLNYCKNERRITDYRVHSFRPLTGTMFLNIAIKNAIAWGLYAKFPSPYGDYVS